MKGFMLANGDLSISNGEIDMVEGAELTAQTIGSVLSTNKGEWIFNVEEGVNFDVIFGRQRIKATASSAKDTYYLGEIATMKSNDSVLAEKLRRRLDGE